jgi:hypothetical protein
MEESLNAIVDELLTRPLAINKYRTRAGQGVTQTFGVVNRRSLPPDYSRLCWKRPKLYKMLLDFGARFVPIPYTSITVNHNYRANPHRDKGNVGPSFLIGAGDYKGGTLRIYEGDLSGCHDISGRPLITDFSKALHGVEEFEGNRFSLVYYTARKAETLPLPTVLLQEGRYVFYRGEQPCNGLPHPLLGRKKS